MTTDSYSFARKHTVKSYYFTGRVTLFFQFAFDDFYINNKGLLLITYSDSLRYQKPLYILSPNYNTY